MNPKEDFIFWNNLLTWPQPTQRVFNLHPLEPKWGVPRWVTAGGGTEAPAASPKASDSWEREQLVMTPGCRKTGLWGEGKGEGEREKKIEKLFHVPCSVPF